MSREFVYDLKKAVLTAFVLSVGSIFIFSVNSSDALNPAWNNFFLVVFPALWFISFIPLIIPSKWSKEK